MTTTAASTMTIVEALERRVGAGEDVAIWLESLDVETQELTPVQLLELARRSAAALAAAGVERGDRVVIVLPTGIDFVAAFYGTVTAGATAVPLYPPAAPHQLPGFVDSLRRVVGLCRPSRIVTLAGLDAPILADREIAAATEVVLVESLRGDGFAPEDAPPPPGPDDVALIQFSSGSTSDPRGVALTHENIVSNIRAFQASLDIGPPDRVTSWLPLYHDMGLIGTLLGSVVTQIPLALFSPLDFLRRPAMWLELLSRREMTIAVAPQFAYNLCLAKISDDDLEGLDLSRVRVMMNGAEPVDVEVVRRFEDRFAAAGLRRGVVTPCYGLAESALAVTMSIPLVDVNVRRLDRDTGEVLGERETAGERLMLVASAGPPVPGTEVRIVGGSGEDLGEHAIGEIAVHAASNCRGYVTDDGIVPIVDDEGWLRTGDLGFLSDGEVYPVDRRKDVVIVQGRNLYPQDIEREVGKIPGTLRGRVAAFGVADARLGTEGVVVAAEVRLAAGAELARCAAQVRGAVVRGFGVTPHDVVLLEKGGLPLTSSGKVRRHRIRQQYAEGRLDGVRYTLREASGRSQEAVA